MAKAVFFITADEAEPEGESLYHLSGFLIDDPYQPIVAAEVQVFLDNEATVASHAESKDDGSWVVDLPKVPRESVRIEIERAPWRQGRH